jgi:hypothetical protein
LRVAEEVEIPQQTPPVAAEVLEATSPQQALQFLVQSPFKWVPAVLVPHQPPVLASKVATRHWATLWLVAVVEERALTHPQPHQPEEAAPAISQVVAVVVLEEAFWVQVTELVEGSLRVALRSKARPLPVTQELLEVSQPMVVLAAQAAASARAAGPHL